MEPLARGSALAFPDAHAISTGSVVSLLMPGGTAFGDGYAGWAVDGIGDANLDGFL